MQIQVDQDLCISCGACVDICPEVFGWNNEEKSWPLVDEVPPELEDDVTEAIQGCPTEAIAEK